MNNKVEILLFEDSPGDAELAVPELRKEVLRFEYIRIDTRDEFIKILRKLNRI